MQRDRPTPYEPGDRAFTSAENPEDMGMLFAGNALTGLPPFGLVVTRSPVPGRRGVEKIAVDRLGIEVRDGELWFVRVNMAAASRRSFEAKFQPVRFVAEAAKASEPGPALWPTRVSADVARALIPYFEAASGIPGPAFALAPGITADVLRVWADERRVPTGLIMVPPPLPDVRVGGLYVPRHSAPRSPLRVFIGQRAASASSTNTVFLREFEVLHGLHGGAELESVDVRPIRQNDLDQFRFLGDSGLTEDQVTGPSSILPASRSLLELVGTWLDEYELDESFELSRGTDGMTVGELRQLLAPVSHREADRYL
jgi:hypothetical protein